MGTTLPRMQLMEIEDCAWLPGLWRNLMTDYLRFLAEWLGLYDGALVLLQEVLERGHVEQVVDLCSGAGGPLPRLVRKLREGGLNVSAVLTDKYPSTDRHASKEAEVTPGISYFAEPVDARNVPPTLIGLRTLFTCFHHFEPTDALRIINNASSSGIAVFEITERSAVGMLRVLALTLAAPFLVFFIRPFSWNRILWTLVNVVPLLCFWDGIVSQLRTYTTGELQGLLAQSGCAERGRVGRLSGNHGIQVTYLVIEPSNTCL